jgi:hypothetical protein
MKAVLKPPFCLKSKKTRLFLRTDRKMAAQMDFCPHELEVGPHGTAYCPHRSNYRRTDGKMAARNDLLPHGNGMFRTD